jgi:release factor glutamine methyltransferase
MPKTIQDLYQELSRSLKIDEASLEARLILESVLNISATEIVSNAQSILTQNQINKIYQIRDKRNQQRIPLAYLLEDASFCGLKFFVNDDVLIPRPETELLLERTLIEIKQRKIHQPIILDLCTGSGCIAIALKLALPAAQVYASDISSAALNVAAINAKRHQAKVEFVLGDYLEPFLPTSLSPIALPIIKTKPPYFDLIVSNPPYVSEAAYLNLEPELHHEPKHALVGFPYAHIKRQSKNLIKDNGFMIFEFGEGQASALLEIFPESTVYKDYSGIERILVT